MNEGLKLLLSIYQGLDRDRLRVNEGVVLLGLYHSVSLAEWPDCGRFCGRIAAGFLAAGEGLDEPRVRRDQGTDIGEFAGLASGPLEQRFHPLTLPLAPRAATGFLRLARDRAFAGPPTFASSLTGPGGDRSAPLDF